MSKESTSTSNEPSGHPDVPFGANEVRLSWWQWIVVFVFVGTIVFSLPGWWVARESIPFETNFRVPYELSKDYWLYEEWLKEADAADAVFVVGDSVVWGEYVSRTGTLSAFLNESEAGERTFVNAGVNGLFPLALEGLVKSFGSTITERRVLLHCNLLWMTSEEADLSSSKEQRFNHPRLVPQFSPRIPCYRASFDERLGIVIERNSSFLSFVRHLQNTYFEQKGLYQWTLADDGDYPPQYPNTYRLPHEMIRFEVPGEYDADPDRGEQSARHKPWSTTGEGAQNFPWVPLESSLQWKAFQRLVEVFQKRGNQLLVVVGPLNRHIMSAENQVVFDDRQSAVVQWLEDQEVSHVVPEPLAWELYGDASHPLTEGYRVMASALRGDAVFEDWLESTETQ